MVFVKKENKKQKDQLDAFRKKEAEDLAKIMASRYKIPYLNLNTTTIDLDSLKIIPEEDARTEQIVVFQSIGKKLAVAIVNPTLPHTKQALEVLKNQNYKLEVFLVSQLGLEHAFAKYAEMPKFEKMESGIIKISAKRMEEFTSRIDNISTLSQMLTKMANKKEVRKISEVLEMILIGALQLETSDLHIEPRETDMRLRFRIDGVLQDISKFSPRVYELMLSRIKLVSELKLNVHNKPQDGRFTIRTDDLDIEVRTSILPGPNGESIVLRVLHPKTISLTLNDLGLHPNVQEILEQEIKKPNGMILTTGPTGSGKTTTLYAFIKKVNTSGIKIITIEDPVEYHIEGITQTQIEPQRGYDFASGLRSILRQDPDVILIGEIRDLDTAKTALHAALTGHLVFSTLHTNNAAGTIPRLTDLGAKPNIMAPAINSTMAQRLIRKLCIKCKKSKKPSAETRTKIQKILQKLPDKYKKKVSFSEKTELQEVVGCIQCDNTGFKGRIGVFEVFTIDEQVENLILKASSTEQEFQKAAEDQGMLTMYQDGILKVIQGITSIQELERLVPSEI